MNPNTYSNIFKLLLLIVIFKGGFLTAQSNIDQDAWMLKNIHNQVLANGKSYEWLRSLTTEAPGRLAGSPAAAAAVELTKQIMDSLGFDKVYLQPCTVPHWTRGEKK